MSREKTRLFCPGTSNLNGTGKGLNAQGETTSQTCSEHVASPKVVNNIALSGIAHYVSTYRFSVWTFHAGIQFSECLLQISYRIETKNGT